MRITISGMPGSGKTTVAKVISEKLKMEHYYMGAIRRNIARDKGITLDELNKLSESNPETDKLVDDYLVKLGRTEDNFIAEGRTASYFIPDSIKIFMAVDMKTAAERILKDINEKGMAKQRNEKSASNIADEVKMLEARIGSDQLRYKKYYNIDIFDRKMYDLWIYTTDLSPEQVVGRILAFITQYQKKKKV